VGLIGASGTGLQQVSSLIHQCGGGVSQMIGLGGHDLLDEVGGVMMLESLRRLENDPATETIVLVSKPPSKAVQDKILETVRKEIKKRVVIHFVGSKVDHAHGADTLEDAALLAMGLPPLSPKAEPRPAGRPVRKLYGLFSGGTFQAEAAALLKGQDSVTLIDLGADEYTRGKPHPMIDFSTRLEVIKQTAAADPRAVLILDVVLGFGAHADPVGELLPVLPSR
jgi:FdrA protein